MQANRQRLIRELFDEYIEMYAARDDRLTGRFSENFSGYTGGGNFLVKDVNEWVRITRQDFAQVTGRIRIEMLDLSMQDISDDVVVVTAFFHIHLPMPDRVLSRETARLVLVFRLEGTDWKITHSGISIPYHLVEEGEVYPLKGLRARNNELAALVAQGAQALQQSEARFRSFVENLNDVLFVLTPSGEFSYLSPQWQESFGHELSDSVGQPFAAYVHPEDVPGFFAFLHQIVDSGEKQGGLEYRVRCKDGNYKWHTANASRLNDAAKGTLAVIGIGRDITERKHNEAVIKASEQRFRDLVNTTDGIVWEADASTFNFTFISEKAERLLGFPAADWLQPGFWVAHLHPQDQTWAPAYCASCTGRLEPHDFEYRFIARDGRTVWLRDIVTVVAENGQPRWLRGVMVDVSQQKLMEAQLREARQMIEDVQRISRLGGWKFDCATATVKWTPEVYQIYGVGPEFDPGDTQQGIAFYHPDDVPTITHAFRHAVEHAEPYDLELRLNRPDGQTIWIRTVGRPLVESGKVISVTGTILDITERKRAEEEIKSLAFYDTLTHLPNRRLLFDRLTLALAACTRRQQQGALMFIDLDKFKMVNDTFGHDVGDLLLQEVAQRLKACVRETDSVARLGGDEFVVMLDQLDETHDDIVALATKIGQKILDSLGAPYFLAGSECHNTPSIGITLFDGNDTTAEDILKRADQAMYKAKAAGSNGFCFEAPPMPM